LILGNQAAGLGEGGMMRLISAKGKLAHELGLKTDSFRCDYMRDHERTTWVRYEIVSAFAYTHILRIAC
jgi:hypothetical protein